MILIWLAILFFVFILSFKRTSLGVCGYLAIRILIPNCVRLTPIVDTSLSTAAGLIILLFAIKDIFFNKESKFILKDTYFKKLIVFCILLYVPLRFSLYTNYQEQQHVWVQFVITNILPLLATLVAIRNKNDLKYIILTFMGCVSINVLYGIFTLIINANPYTWIIKALYSTSSNVSYVSELSERGGVLSTSSTFENSNGWGYFLPITFVLLFFFYKKNRTNLVLLLSVLVSICVILCAKRSALIAYMVFWLLYFFISDLKGKLDLIKWGCIFVFITIIVISIFPQLASAKHLIESSFYFWDDSISQKNDISGSSWTMRLEQFTYPWVEIKDNILFGHGFGWCQVYLTKHLYHPIMYGFESILTHQVCEGGLSAVFLWSWLFKFSYSYCSFTRQNSFAILLIGVQLVIAVATGFDYLFFFGFYVILIQRYIQYYEKNICCNRNI